MKTEPITEACVRCGKKCLTRVMRQLRQRIAGQEFRSAVEAARCTNCSHEHIEEELECGFQLEVAEKLAATGPLSGQVFSFMRQVVGLSQDGLARLFGIPVSMVADWESAGRGIVDRSAFIVLGTLVHEHASGSRATMDLLLKLSSRPTLRHRTISIPPHR